ncbi:hypothetical protein [Stenotrophomonas nitritireducens]|uniref:hypothetical protein n=1 Tax=Stenotrophomonas nitritireducens TaxID=83617 RepID=UPI001C129DF3|nr:hypothetical protein [Stenotrophomonas nitritireducens]
MDTDYIINLISSICCAGIYRCYCGHHTINNQGLIITQRIGRTGAGQREDGIIASRITDGATAQSQGSSGDVIQIGSCITRLHSISKGQ